MSYYSMAYPIDNVIEARQQIDTNAKNAKDVLFKKAQTEWEMLSENQECLRYIEICNDVNRSDGKCNDFFYYDKPNGTFRKCVTSKNPMKYCGRGKNKNKNEHTCPLEEIYKIHIRIQEGQIEFEKRMDELFNNLIQKVNDGVDPSKIEQPHPYVILEIAENVSIEYNIPPQTMVTSIKEQEAINLMNLYHKQLNHFKPRRSKKNTLKLISRAFDKASRKASSTAYGSAFGIGGRKRKSKKHKKRKTKRKSRSCRKT